MKDRTVGIVGLGYVGLPLALGFCRAQYKVFGVDADPDRLASLREGRSYITDVSDQEVREFVESGSLCPSAESSALASAEAICICVPTPLRKSQEPDLSYVVAAAQSISRVLQPGQTIVLESTVYPGATDTLVAPILEESGLRAGIDFYLAFSPERVNPGDRTTGLAQLPKLVGGINEESTRKAMDLYQAVFHTLIPMASAKEAEMAKLLENTFRAVNIGLVNEMAIMAHRMGINIWRVVEAAASKPFGFMVFYPGPGWGGHCIPVDPLYLSWRARSDGVDAGFIDHAVQINNLMPRYVVERVTDLLNDCGKPLRGTRLLLLGVAYKRDVADVRESPALSILTSLQQKQARVAYHDPYVPRLHLNGTVLESQPLDSEFLAQQDCVIIATDHSCLDYESIAQNSRLVFDTRNAMGRLRGSYPHIHLL